MNSPGNAERRSVPKSGAQRCKPDQTRTTSPVAIVHRAQHVVDCAALLALDVAAIATESGRAHHARAVMHLLDAAHFSWLAAEVLVEGVTQ
jgi:hypothetical protein